MPFMFEDTIRDSATATPATNPGGSLLIGEHSDTVPIAAENQLSYNVDRGQLEYIVSGQLRTIASSEDIGFYANIMTLVANNGSNIMQQEMRLDALEPNSSD